MSRRNDHRDVLAAIDIKNRPKLDRLRDKLERLEETLKSTDLDEPSLQALYDATSDVRTMKAEVEQASQSLQDLLGTVRTLSQRLGDEVKLRNSCRRALEQIDRAMLTWPIDPEEYATALIKYCEEFPNSPRSISMRKVIDEKANWAGALACSKLGRHWKLAPNGSDLPAEAESRVNECDTLLAEATLMPDKAVFEEFRDYFQAIADRTRGNDPLRGRINALLSLPIIDKVYVITIRFTTGKIDCYWKDPCNKTDKNITVHVIDDREGKLTHSVVAGFDDVTGGLDRKSPQWVLAETLKSLVEARGELQSWDAMMLLFLDLTLQTTTDDLLKFAIIKGLTQIAGDGSKPLAIALEPVVKQLEAAKIRDNLRWMIASDNDSKNARPRATEAIRLIRLMLPDVTRTCLEAHQKIASNFAAIPQPVGWLVKEGDGWLAKDGRWTCRPITGVTFPETADLCVASKQTQGTWEVIGNVTDHAPRVVAKKKVNELVEGRIIFVRPKAGPGGR